MRTLYRTKEEALKALKESGEVQAYRTDDGDIFAWWE